MVGKSVRMTSSQLNGVIVFPDAATRCRLSASDVVVDVDVGG